MNRASHLLRRKLSWSTLAVLAALGLRPAGGVQEALAQGAGVPVGPPVVSPASPTAPPEIVKPALPSELDSAETVFKRLDVDKRGYVTLEDTKDLLGFKEAFQAVDTKDTGKLSASQFSKAWAIYKKKK